MSGGQDSLVATNPAMSAPLNAGPPGTPKLGKLWVGGARSSFNASMEFGRTTNIGRSPAGWGTEPFVSSGPRVTLPSKKYSDRGHARLISGRRLGASTHPCSFALGWPRRFEAPASAGREPRCNSSRVDGGAPTAVVGTSGPRRSARYPKVPVLMQGTRLWRQTVPATFKSPPIRLGHGQQGRLSNAKHAML